MMYSIADIIPRAVRRGHLGQRMTEQEVLDSFEAVMEYVLPGDLGASVRAVYLRSRVLTIASLSAYSTQIIKQRESEILTKIREKNPGAKIDKLRILA